MYISFPYKTNAGTVLRIMSVIPGTLIGKINVRCLIPPHFLAGVAFLNTKVRVTVNRGLAAERKALELPVFVRQSLFGWKLMRGLESAQQ